MAYTYTLYSGPSATGPWTQVDTGVTATADTISNLTPNTQYYFRIITIDTVSGLASVPTIVGPYSTAASQQAESAEGTLIVPSNAATAKINASKTYGSASNGPYDVWGLDTGGLGGGQVVVNGVDDSSTSFVIAVYYHNHFVYQENTNLDWWYWNGSWIATTNPIPAAPALAINNLSTVNTNTAFTVGGTAQNYTSIPSFQYMDNNTNTWTALPSPTITLTTTNNYSFSFTHPAIAATSTSYTVSVRDANSTATTATSNTFAVITPGSTTISNITLSSATVSSTAGSGTIIGAISVQTIGSTFNGTLSLTGADAAKFAIVGNNLVLSPAVGLLTTTAGQTIADSFGNNWGFNSGGLVTYNGTADTTTSVVIAVGIINGIIYQENSAINWYSKTAIQTPVQGTWAGPVTAPAIGLPAGVYNVSIIATQNGATGSPFTKSFTINSTNTSQTPIAGLIEARYIRNNWGMETAAFNANGAAGLNYLNTRWIRIDYQATGSNGSLGTTLSNAMVSANMFDPNLKISAIIDGYYQDRTSFPWSAQQPSIQAALARRNSNNNTKIFQQFEGPNEFGWGTVQGGGSVAPNSTVQLGQSYGGAPIPANIRAGYVQWAQAISTFRNANTALFTGVTVTGATLLDFTGNAIYNDINVAQYIDYGNIHWYLSPSQGISRASNGFVAQYNQLKQSETGSTKEMVMTECGMNTQDGCAQDRISEAWMVLCQFLDFFAIGGKRLFWYTMTTGSDDSRAFQWFDGFTNNETTCSAATAQPRTKVMRNMGDILSLGNTYTNTGNLTDTAIINYPYDGSTLTITGMTNASPIGTHLILPKSDGTTMIAIWREPVLDDGTGAALSQVPAANTVTVNLGGTYTYNVWDPTGATANQQGGRVVTTPASKIVSAVTGSTLNLTLYGYPLFVELTATATAVGLGAYTGDVSAGAGTWQANQAVFSPNPVRYFTTYIDEAQQSSTWASYAEYLAGAMNIAGLNAASGSIPQIGWGLGTRPEGALFSQIIAGNYDVAFRSAVASFASRGWATIVIRIGWEMNIAQPWAVNSGNASQYVAAWQHMASVLHAAATTNGITVICNWCPNVGVNQNDGSVSIAQMYPGNTACDMLGIDTYDQPIGGPVPGGTDNGGFNYLVNTMFAMGASNNKPVSFGEVGITTTSWATALVNCCNARPAGVKIAFVGFWDVNVDGSFKFSGGANSAVASILQGGFGNNGSVHN